MRWLLPLAIITLFISIVKSAVIGIDFGSRFYKMSLIAPGKTFVIVESMSSQRKVSNALSFVQNKRQYDGDAVGKKVRFPSNSFTFVNKFLGALENNEEVFEISKTYYEEFVTSFDNRGNVQFELKNFKFEGYDDEDDVIILRVEVVVAQILKYAKMLADKMGKTDIKDCVITVPTHWGLAQREALIQAAEIAGLFPLNLISENTAAGLYYGVERKDVNKTHTVLFYNIGATNLQTSLIEYSTVEQSQPLKNTTKTVESVNVLADYGVSNVGGSAYDKLIADYFAEQIDKRPDRQGKPSVKENGRIMRRLLKECIRTKEILSANKDAVFYSEGLFDGNDFQGIITRKEFEERAKDLLSHLTYPIDEIMKRANKTISDIDAVELIGGGTRIPIIQEILQDKIGKELELGQHMNGDESMALGASFNGANYSHSFRVRDVLLTDGYNFEVKAEIKSLDENLKEGDEGYYYKQFSLFPYKKRFGTKKSVTLTQKQNLQLQLTTVDYEGIQTPYAQFNLTNIDKIQKDKFYNETVKPKVHLEFEVSSTEGILLNEAEVRFNYTARERVPKKEAEAMLKLKDRQTEKNKKEALKKATTEAKKLAKDNGENPDDVVVDLETLEYEQGKLKPEIHVTTETDGENGKSETILYRIKHKQKQMTVDVKEQYYHYTPLNRTEFKKSQRLVKRFDLYEERQRNLSDTKNKYETFIYQIRDWVVDEYFMKYIKEDDLQKLIEQREIDQEWLDSDEAFNGNITVYQNRLKGLEDLSFPTLRRLEEARLRPEYVNKTIEELQNFQKKLQILEKDHKWLNDTQLEPFKTLLNETIDWVKESLDKQKEVPLNEDPAFSVYELKPKFDELYRVYNNVKAIKEPKVLGTDKKEKKEKKSKKAKDMPKKQTIKIDGEDVEIDFEKLKKEQEFKNFDFSKFQENLKKEEERKKREEAQQAKEDAKKADLEEEEIEGEEDEQKKSDL